MNFSPLCLTLPWPPSNNTYFRHVGPRVLISKKGREYRVDVVASCAFRVKTRTGALKLTIVFNPPDLRRRDLDNLPKALFDSLKHAGIYEDDSQIRHVDMRFGKVIQGGLACVTISPFVDEEW